MVINKGPRSQILHSSHHIEHSSSNPPTTTKQLRSLEGRCIL